jgi:autotransporter-associated beta strand protein
MVADGTNHLFSGVIADGGPLIGDNISTGPTPQGPGKQIGIISFAAQINGGGGTLTLAGSNTYSGSTRIDQGASIKLVGNGTIGFPTATGSLTGPMRVYGPGGLDLNGHNQTIALMTSGNAAARIYNSAACTVSTLTFGYGNEQVATRNAGMQFIDNLGTGGLLAMKKVATGPAYLVPGTLVPATNCTQTLSGVNTYSGDTTVAGGHLIFANATAVSSNSAFRLFTVAQGQCPDSSVSLVLNYADTAPVRQLWIDGVQQPNGVYGAGTPGINPNSTGTLTVTGYAPLALNFSQSGNSLTLSWEGVYKLQAKTNNISGPWSDYPGCGLSPVTVPINPATGQVYFRLTTY